MRGMKAKEEYNSPFVEGEALMDPFFLKYPLRGMKLMKKYHRGWGDLQPLMQYAGKLSVVYRLD